MSKGENYFNIKNENEDLKKALNLVENRLEKCNKEKLSSQENLNFYRELNDEIKEEVLELKKKNNDLIEDMIHKETNMKENLKNIQEQLNDKQRELNEIQIKILNQNDLELEKIKITGKLEIQYSNQLSIKEDELSSVKNELNRLKIDYKILYDKYEESDKIFDEKYNFINSTLSSENDLLKIKINKLENDNQNFDLKEKIFELEKEKEILKTQNMFNDTQIKKLYNDLDILRKEKNDILIDKTRQIELEREENRSLKLEKDKILLSKKSLQEELMRKLNKFETNENKINDLLKERQEILDKIYQKEQRILEHQSRITEIEENSRVQEMNLREKYIKELNAEKSKLRIEKDKKNNLKEDLLEIENNKKDLDYSIKKLNKNIKEKDKEIKKVFEMYNESELKNVKLIKEIEKLKIDFDRKYLTIKEESIKITNTDNINNNINNNNSNFDKKIIEKYEKQITELKNSNKVLLNYIRNLKKLLKEKNNVKPKIVNTEFSKTVNYKKNQKNNLDNINYDLEKDGLNPKKFLLLDNYENYNNFSKKDDFLKNSQNPESDKKLIFDDLKHVNEKKNYVYHESDDLKINKMMNKEVFQCKQDYENKLIEYDLNNEINNLDKKDYNLLKDNDRKDRLKDLFDEGNKVFNI